MYISTTLSYCLSSYTEKLDRSIETLVVDLYVLIRCVHESTENVRRGSLFDELDKHVGIANFLCKSCGGSVESPNRLIYQSFRIIRLAIFHLFGSFHAY